MQVKELSTEEKAKRYDEVIERLRNAFYDNSGRMCEEYRKAVIRIIEPIFPELADSEDERTRKFLISFVELNSGVNLLPEKAKKILAWLEKRGEQKPAWKPTGEQMKFLWKYAEQNNYDGMILASLFNDLKKLREG